LLLQTPLSLATLANKPQLVRLLVERGATVNSQVYESGCQGSGPFCAAVHIASSHGQPYLNTLSELLKSPTIDFTVVDSQGSVHSSLAYPVLPYERLIFGIARWDIFYNSAHISQKKTDLIFTTILS